MVYSDSLRRLALTIILGFGLSVISYPIYAQSGESIEALKSKADTFIKQQRYTEALPLLEKIVAAEPMNAEMQLNLGFALVGQAANTKDDAQRKAVRIRARNAFIKAIELGKDTLGASKLQLAKGLVDGIPADGAGGNSFSQNDEANNLMVEAEAFFSQGKLDNALKNYQKALQLDPKLYEAALFCGDVFTQKGDYAQAGPWYEKAIAIDPNRETAYRYSATPLMKQSKFDAARDRYIEAFISDPFNRVAVSGILQWGQATKTQLAHPTIEIPTNVKFDEKGNAKIDLGADALLNGAQDGSFAWIAYGAARTEWHKEKFAKTFPNEKTYRHSLAEEADAIRSVLTLATADKKTKNLNPSLMLLKKLNDAGVLEAYILLVRADEGIVRDFADYRNQNRDKLRRYVLEFVIGNDGK